MGFAFENPTLTLVQALPALTTSASEADAWFAAHASPYIIKSVLEAGVWSYLYTASRYEGSLWKNFSKVDAAGDTVAMRLETIWGPSGKWIR